MVNCDILSVLRALISELDHGPHDWPSVIDVVASAVNEAPIPRLGANADGMTGIRPRRSLLRVSINEETSATDKNIERERTEKVIRRDNLQASLDFAMLRSASKRTAKKPAKNTIVL